MTVTSTIISAGPYYPNGVTTVFPFGFKALTTDEVAVATIAGGTETVVDPALYTVSLSDTGGSVTFATAPTADLSPLFTIAAPSFLQEISFPPEGAFLAEVHDEAFDRSALRDLLLLGMTERTISVPIGETGGTLPSAADRANLLLGFNQDGDPTAFDPGLFAKGDSAYQSWLDAGHTGSVDDFLDSLQAAVSAGAISTALGYTPINAGASLTAGASGGAQGLTRVTNFATLASKALNDIYARWWDGTQIKGGDGGIAFNQYNIDGVTFPYQWQITQLHSNIYWRWKKLGDADSLGRIASNATALKARIGAGNIGTATPANEVGASDDAGWNATLYCQIHEATGDAFWLTAAQSMVTNARTRFADTSTGNQGWLKYQDGTNGTPLVLNTTLYEATMACAAAYVYKQNGNATMLAYAVATWTWMNARLKSPSRSIYWDELEIDPANQTTYGKLHLLTNGRTDANAEIQRYFSYSRIGGNCWMATLCARLYAITADTKYLTEAASIVAGMKRSDTFLRDANVWVCDADPWTDGCGVPYLVSEVLSLPGVDDDGSAKQIVANTAKNIADSRTDQFYSRLRFNGATTSFTNYNWGAGLYSATSWSGPEFGYQDHYTYEEVDRFPENIPLMGSCCCVITAGWLTNLTAQSPQFVTTTLFNRKLAEASGQRYSRYGGDLAGEINATGHLFSAQSIYAGNSLSFFLGRNGSGQPLVNYQAGTYTAFNPTSSAYFTAVNNTIISTLDSSGGAVFQGGITGAGIIQGTADGNTTLGSPSRRMGQVYSITSTINTSDEREKQWRGALTDAELAAARAISSQEIGIYQWLDKIAEKGADKARLHVGVRAQRVAAAFTSQGLDPTRYGVYCYDEYLAHLGQAEVIGTPALHDDKGFIIDPGTPSQVAVPSTPAGNRYGIRPNELAFFLIAAQEVRLAALEAKAA